MHRMSLNRVSLSLSLRPRSGFVIKSGDKAAAMLRPELPDSQAMRTKTVVSRDGEQGEYETVFIPGSSLKGTFRSASERILRSLGPRPLACDPHDHQSTCQRGPDLPRRLRGWERTAQTHRALCLACRLFGSQQAAGRALFCDALPTVETRAVANDTQRRAGVALDRRTGGPARGKLYETEVVWGGDFATTLHLENYQVWQLALLATVIEDVNFGLVRLGSARTRGLGGFDVQVKALQVQQLQVAGVDGPAGVGRLRPDLAEAYGWIDDVQVDPAQAPDARIGVRKSWQWTDHKIAVSFLDRCVEASWKPLVQLAAEVAHA